MRSTMFLDTCATSLICFSSNTSSERQSLTRYTFTKIFFLYSAHATNVHTATYAMANISEAFLGCASGANQCSKIQVCTDTPPFILMMAPSFAPNVDSAYTRIAFDPSHRNGL